MMLDFFGVSIQENIFVGENWLLIAIALIWLVVAVVQDFKRREVENWWSFSLIAFALAYRAFLSIENWNIMYFAWGLMGLIVGFALCNVFYYGRMFAGGDAKLMMALGAVIPLGLMWQTNLIILFAFLIFTIFSGAVYGLAYSVVLTALNFKEFKKEFSKRFRKYRKTILIACIIELAALALFLISQFYLFAVLVVLAFLVPFLFMYALTIEEVNMKKFVSARDLTIGDWLAKPLKVHGKTIKPDWEGLSERELRLIQKYCKKKVLVKYGIPFTPAFLFGFALTLVYFWLF